MVYWNKFRCSTTLEMKGLQQQAKNKSPAYPAKMILLIPNLTHLKQCVILILPYPIGGKGEAFSSTLMNTLSGIRYALSDLYAHRTIMFMYLPANLGKLSPVLAGMMHYKGYINAESEKTQSM